jgi:hypothetical protein
MVNTPFGLARARRKLTELATYFAHPFFSKTSGIIPEPFKPTGRVCRCKAPPKAQYP